MTPAIGANTTGGHTRSGPICSGANDDAGADGGASDSSGGTRRGLAQASADRRRRGRREAQAAELVAAGVDLDQPVLERLVVIAPGLEAEEIAGLREGEDARDRGGRGRPTDPERVTQVRTIGGRPASSAASKGAGAAPATRPISPRTTFADALSKRHTPKPTIVTSSSRTLAIVPNFASCQK